MSIAQSTESVASWRGTTWPMAVAVLGAGLAVLGLAFSTEVAAAVDIWDRSTAYNHCWLVLPLALWLAWARRHRLAVLRPEPTLLAAVPALGAGLAWLAAERLGIMEGRQLAALSLTICFILAVVGWRVGRAMAAPLLYLFFLVPFGAFLTPVLQKVTAWFIVAGLQLLQIPHYADDLIIEIPAGTFLVAEACAGLRFIIAALAFGALYGFVMFRSLSRRLAVMLLAIVVPVVANGLRALGIVLLGHHLGSAQAAAADHLVYGWIFFSIVILLLVAAGLPFREDGRPADVAPADAAVVRRLPAVRGAALVTAALICGLVALAGPSLAMALNRASVTAEARPAPLFAPADCQAVGAGTLRCGDGTLQVNISAFSPRSTWSQVASARYELAGDDDEALLLTVKNSDALWQLRQDRDAARIVASAAWLNGEPVGDGLRSRLAQGWNSLRGDNGRPVLVTLLWRPDSARDGTGAVRDRNWLRKVLEEKSMDLGQQAAELSRPG
ncbi:exosortase A [Roseomonas marmotae]|uniref:Exosortase n=1 Tax=Roseomonas marmotae TaxID=2768161 RepID=A0ABS3KJJ9_9PROT|nr:exosortase A [Roseomonas marmotae]MBO1076788.1 exosortase [Roseomonas marmotae]QTI78685.1 exosortase [Roseomonas marmotae]